MPKVEFKMSAKFGIWQLRDKVYHIRGYISKLIARWPNLLFDYGQKCDVRDDKTTNGF